MVTAVSSSTYNSPASSPVKRRGSVAGIYTVPLTGAHGLNSPLSPLASRRQFLPGPSSSSNGLLSNWYTQNAKEVELYKDGKAVIVDGQTLSIAAVAATARHGASVQLSNSHHVRRRVEKSLQAISDKVDNGISVYGVTTGFGGSADTRTDSPGVLGHALLQMQHIGVLPTQLTRAPRSLPLNADPLAAHSMPEAWVRGAMLIRMNSLIRGHSGVRFELIEKMGEVLNAGITPVVPLRGSISASGDLSPLSYIAGTVIGNPTIYCFDGVSTARGRDVKPADEALRAHGIEPLPSLSSKEPLGILNGTAFSASVGALAANEATQLALLTHVCTAMGVEAMNGTRGSFDPFIHDVARPHPGQIESARLIWELLEGSQLAQGEGKEVTIEEDTGKLRQDRYSLRTAPQFLGPQIEDLLHSLQTLLTEVNSTTDNPLIDGESGRVHNGGNFQAMAVTNAMEKTRLSLHHLGKLIFAQSAELVTPSMNHGLPPSLAATDPSLDYHGKGIDIATAAYVAELGYLANPVSTHIQSAEMHNQSVNSLALISARQTITSLDVLTILISSYLYMLCQALDLRAMQSEFCRGFDNIIVEEFSTIFASSLDESEQDTLLKRITDELHDAFENTSTMDTPERMKKVAAASTTAFVDFFTAHPREDEACDARCYASIAVFRSRVASRAGAHLNDLRRAYLSGERGPAPATAYLGKTKPFYEFVRVDLGVCMHGAENLDRFSNGMGVDDVTIGQKISVINEAIRDGQMQSTIVSALSSLPSFA
ncbi:phenylalanine ammonia-lyase [Schizophyllum commune H4-8]|uniref:Phenylalanine ammonia-lyase n=1 Tax=Schizophyllum commune (strain H4-8 / FGSC 9210) TaxID=578458 RepID=D8Q9U2_SCHCM|nr:phenylalanine ammonia-lyase [Schizophyllum commune H4-8]KAI5890284.1 phenylalanine ammonia-lyase [Schizophyllum commune H4-8]